MIVYFEKHNLYIVEKCLGPIKGEVLKPILKHIRIGQRTICLLDSQFQNWRLISKALRITSF